MKFRFVLLLLLMVLFTILVLQNKQETTFNIFFWQLNSPLILLTVVTGVMGIILGLIIAKVIDTRKTKINKHKGVKDIDTEIKPIKPDVNMDNFDNFKK